MRPTRVLVCDDSPTYAAGLRRLLEREPEIEVVAVHKSAEAAIAAIPELAPDVVTMDLELPGMDGLAAVQRIMREHPLPVVVLSSRLRMADALAAGAAAALSKGELRLREPEGDAAAELRRRVRLLAA